MDAPEVKQISQPPAEVGEITRILQDWDRGDKHAVDELMPYVVNELRQIARRSLRKYRPGQADDTLQATALVSEAYLKLRNAKSAHLSRRGDFYALCAEIIKHIVIDYVRRKRALKHGGGVEVEPLDEMVFNVSWIRNSRSRSVEDLLVFQEMLDRLGARYERESEVLSLKYNAGCTDEEIAQALGVSIPTVRRDLTYARAWIRREVDAMTAEIYNRAALLKDPSARKQYLDESCAGNEALLKDVELLLKKSPPRAK